MTNFELILSIIGDITVLTRAVYALHEHLESLQLQRTICTDKSALADLRKDIVVVQDDMSSLMRSRNSLQMMLRDTEDRFYTHSPFRILYSSYVVPATFKVAMREGDKEVHTRVTLPDLIELHRHNNIPMPPSLVAARSAWLRSLPYVGALYKGPSNRRAEGI